MLVDLERLRALARKLGGELGPGDRVLLEGPMGAGKTTFARALLEGLGVEQPPEGSPSFAIAHEYRARALEVVHIDFYRIKSDAEIAESGIEAYFWEREGAVVIAEWTSLWPDFERAVVEAARARGGTRALRVTLAFDDAAPGSRRLGILVEA
jgi:tRNA threonylcarbamoyl adenosine modification protein YjeE